MQSERAPPERSLITVLSADVVGSTRHIANCEPDDAQAFFDFCFEHLRGAIERAGGLLVSYEGDGGIAVFGWPGALEDHADQACIAAWEIQNSGADAVGPGGERVRFRVGVHSGLVGVRHIERQGRSRFDTAGASVNIAAKLQQCAAPGGVVVSGETVRLCRALLDLKPHPLPAETEALTINAYRLEACPDKAANGDLARRYPSPIVGRRDELAALRACLPQAGGGRTLLGIVGEAGIGKSRLAAAAVTEALAAGVALRVFYGDAHTRTTPFAAARALITEQLSLPDLVTPELLNSILTGIPIGSSDTSALVAFLAEPDGRSRDRVGRFTQTQIARALANTFVILAATQNSLLLVEDLHLVDSESRQFLRLIGRSARPEPFCLILTGRPEALAAIEEITGTVVRLEPLPDDDMRTLARQLGHASASPVLLDRAVERADGVPFVLEELIRSIGSTQALDLQALPPSVESVIHARLGRLSPAAKAVAQALSLLGNTVEIDLIKAVVDMDADTLLANLSELERYAFLHPMLGGATRFRHQIIAEACADTIPRDRRRNLHRAALNAIAAQTTNSAGRNEQLAQHAEGAGELMAALGYLWEAALEARRNSAAASLNLIFDRAFGLVDRIGPAADERYVDFVLMTFASMLQLGEFSKMRAHLPRTLELAEHHQRPEKFCSAMSQLGMICWFEGRYLEGLHATEQGLEMARSLQSAALIYSNQLMLANVLHGMGSAHRAISELKQLLELLTGDLESARLGAPSIPRSTVLSFMSWFTNATGDYREGLSWAEQALEIAVREQEAYSQVLARSSMARNMLMLNLNQAAVDCLADALGLSELNGYDAIKANLTGCMATALARTGRSVEAVRLVEDCVRDGLHLRTGQMEVYYLRIGHAEALAGSGERDGAMSILAKALNLARKIDNPSLQIDALGLRARLLARLDPAAPGIGQDLAEQDALCARHGLVAWPVKTRASRASRPG
jgi:class 3 adenylate cyclase/tetratricopeptide (TPR) repeat protein